MEITSLQNPKVKEAVKLRDRKTRDESGLFLIEGYRELLRASQGHVTMQELFICPELFLGSNEQSLLSQWKCPIFQCSEPVFRKLSYRDRPDGLLGVAQQMRKGLDAFKMSPSPFFVIAEAVEKPGNLGTILRSADGAGVDGVIVCDPCTDIYNPNVVRASVGTLFTVPVVEATQSETLAWLKRHQIDIVAATPSAKILYTDANFKGPLAIVVGTEQLGLSEEWMHEAKIRVRIPMRGAADSLNVATATTLLLYEVLRQRESITLR